MARTARSEKMEMRLSPEAKKILREAAQVRHKSMSEFVLDSALSVAEETLLDRRIFRLSAETWDNFMTALDALPSRHPRMERLLKSPSVFD